MFSKGEGYLPFKFYTASSPPNNKISRYGKSKSSSNSSSGPTQNPGAVHLKTDAQFIYDIKLKHYRTLWKDKVIIFPTQLVSYPNKF
jgi:hypothetical protein